VAVPYGADELMGHALDRDNFNQFPGFDAGSP
jgi:hypothetical protein